jgi:hypothetical protein
VCGCETWRSKHSSKGVKRSEEVRKQRDLAHLLSIQEYTDDPTDWTKELYICGDASKETVDEITPGVRRLRLILSLLSSLFFVVIFNVVFEVSLRLKWGWSEVARFVKRALGYSQSGTYIINPCRYKRTRCFLRFLLFFLLQQQTSKAVTSL